MTAEVFPDSVGVGSYRIDLHRSSGGDNYADSYRHANLGVTQITNGCYRLHPVEWNIGGSAGMLAAFTHIRKKTIRQVRNQKPLLADFQKLFIQGQGVEMAWPTLTPR